MEIDIERETQALEQFWQQRNTQLDQDRDIVNLIKPPMKSDVIAWISNEPKVFFETAVSLLSAYPPRFRIPLSINYTAQEREKINKAERFVVGLYRSFDRKQALRGQNYWLRELAYWILSGWYSVFNIAKVEKDNSVSFLADFWDPKTVYPEWDDKELVKCIHSYEVNKHSATQMVTNWQKEGLKSEYSEPTNIKTVKVINYWRKDGKEVRNSIIVGGQIVKPLKLERFKKIPIHVGAIGVPETSSSDSQIRQGESIIAANRDLYQYTNGFLSLLVTILAETAYPNLVTKTVTGNPPLKEGELKGHGTVVPLKIGETIDLLKHASTPQEALQVLTLLIKQMQKGSLPDVVYGGVMVDLSGFAISQLMAAIKYKLNPYLNTMQIVVSNIMSDTLEQYRVGNFPPVRLTTVNPQELNKGLFFVEDFEPMDVPDALFIETSIPITSSVDKTQQILYSRQALSPPQLLSRRTIWDEVLDIQDADQEYARILEDQTLEMPVVKEIMMLEQLKKRSDEMRQAGKIAEADALKRYIMMVEMKLGMRQGIPEVPGRAGVSPETLPPEFGAVKPSPDVLRGMMGISPPGLKRRPETPEERAEKQTGFASLVSPTGERLA